MNHLKLTLFFALLVSSFFAQEKTRFADRLYCGDVASNYQYVQGRFSWSPSNLSYGIQYKRIKSDDEADIYSFFTGQTLALNYARLNDQDLMSANLEAHFRSYPITAGIVRIGAGIDYTSNFDQIQMLSLYPSLGFDIGGVEIIYSYLINRNKSAAVSDHRVSLAVGLWVKSKKR